MLVFTHSDFQLDLTYLNVTFTEINQWFKDDFSTEQSFPFDLYLDSELTKNSGFQAHYNANKNKTSYVGILGKDGETVSAVLTFQSIKGKVISAIIKAGIDNFPSFDKKLSELNLEKKIVVDIIEEAKAVIKKGYPETNYNFPMIHTDKYDPTNSDWHGFQKIINHYSGGQFLTNVLGEEDIDEIKNIMQPLPFLMHVIKTAVEDGGYTLGGDILNDTELSKALVFRDGDYYRRLSEDEIPLISKNNEWTSSYGLINAREHVNFNKEFTIEKKGDYVLTGLISSAYFSQGTSRTSKLYISIEKETSSGVSQLWAIDYLSYNRLFPDHIVELSFDIDIDISFEIGDIIRIKKIEVRRDQTPSLTPDYPEAISLTLTPTRFYNPDGSPILSVLNLNEIDLTRVVPDMTVRELISTIKNLKNYEFIPDGNIIYMNLIENKLNRDTAVNIEDFDVEEPERNYHDDREYELSFTDGKSNDTYKYDSVLVTQDGFIINDYVAKSTVNSIRIDVLPLPVVKRNDITTAFSFEDASSKLRLVFMNPVTVGTPVTFWNENITIPKIRENNYSKWLDFRINSIEWNWEFIISVEKFREITIQTLVYAYKNYHILSEVEKERLDKSWWRITAKTESLV